MTEGIRVVATPGYDATESDPDARLYVFTYRIRITNESDRPVKLLSRHWVIVDADGERTVVRGEGVVGQQPELKPGEHFDYASFCRLTRPWGTMEGTYLMRDLSPRSGESDAPDDKAELFEIAVGRFFLVAPKDVSAT